ncbi:protein draper-like [Physella acuta]|uniref:protein draper-like n=1 Tax=Physella acuta TaxID=109671 RepID=UPI0027DB7186|nr:protein draper-like [Physella acuta]
MATFSVTIFMVLCFHAARAHFCDEGFYGHKCEHKCGNCVGGPIFCDAAQGFCVNGCTWGYQGDTCKEKCNAGTYGISCTGVCSPHCNDTTCHHVTGECWDKGCHPGYTGPKCTETCPKHTYGDNCTLKCNCTHDCGCDTVHGLCVTIDQCREMKWKAEQDLKAEAKRRYERQAGTEPASGNTKRGTQMMCSVMEKEFQELMLKLTNKVDIPQMPLFIVLSVTMIIMFILGICDFLVQRSKDNYRANWEREHLDKALELAENRGTSEKQEDQQPSETNASSAQDQQAS